MKEKRNVMNFEKALKKLEDIVNSMESDEVNLDKALKLFEEGMKLADYCSKELEKAEKKVEKILKKKDGSIEKVDYYEEHGEIKRDLDVLEEDEDLNTGSLDEKEEYEDDDSDNLFDL